MTNVLKLADTTYGAGNEKVAQTVEMVMADIRAGTYGNVRNVILLIENYDGELERVTVGDVIDRARVVGLMTMAIANATAPTG